jgi:hypothetical protein
MEIDRNQYGYYVVATNDITACQSTSDLVDVMVYDFITATLGKTMLLFCRNGWYNYYFGCCGGTGAAVQYAVYDLLDHMIQNYNAPLNNFLREPIGIY